MSILHSRSEQWLIRSAEVPDGASSPVRFVGWVACGERDDYARVVFDPPLEPHMSGVSETLTEAILAPRHAGVTLRDLLDETVDVYVATYPATFSNAERIPPEALRIRMWGLLQRNDYLQK